MNTAMFSRMLKIIGVLLVGSSYLFLDMMNVPLALMTTWFGISIITTSFFIDCKDINTNDHEQSREKLAVRHTGSVRGTKEA